MSFLLPFHNEERAVPIVVPPLLNDLQCRLPNLPSEVLLVENASTDATPAALKNYARFPRVRIIQVPAPPGLGRAVRAGFAAAAGEWICYMPGDGQVPMEEIFRILETCKLGDLDLVQSRRSRRLDRPHRRLMTRFYNATLTRLFGFRFSDAGAKPKLIRRAHIERMSLTSTGWFIDAEILAASHYLNLRAREIEVFESPRSAGRSKVRPAHALHVLKEAIRVRRNWRERMRSSRP